MNDPYSVIEHYLKLALDHSEVNYDPFELNDALDEIKQRELRQQERIQKLEAEISRLTASTSSAFALVHLRLQELEDRFN